MSSDGKTYIATSGISVTSATYNTANNYYGNAYTYLALSGSTGNRSDGNNIFTIANSITTFTNQYTILATGGLGGGLDNRANAGGLNQCGGGNGGHALYNTFTITNLFNYGYLLGGGGGGGRGGHMGGSGGAGGGGGGGGGDAGSLPYVLGGNGGSIINSNSNGFSGISRDPQSSGGGGGGPNGNGGSGGTTYGSLIGGTGGSGSNGFGGAGGGGANGTVGNGVNSTGINATGGYGAGGGGGYGGGGGGSFTNTATSGAQSYCGAGGGGGGGGYFGSVYITNTNYAVGSRGGYGGYSIYNTGTITKLYNSQGGNVLYGQLYYAGNLPTNYYITINSTTSYGQMNCTGFYWNWTPANGNLMTINIDPNSSFTGMSNKFQNVFVGFTFATLPSGTYTLNGYSYKWNITPNITANNYDLNITIVLSSLYTPIYTPVTLSNSLASNIYRHVVLTISGDVFSVYLDGSMIVSTTNNYFSNYSTISQLLIGSAADYTNGFTGFIDDFRVFNRALPLSDISAIYNYYPPVPTTLTLISVTTTSVVLSFVLNRYIDPISYLVSTSPASTTTTSGTNSALTISGLSSNTNYTIQIQSTINSVNSPLSSPLSITTMPNPIIYYNFDSSANGLIPDINNTITNIPVYDASFIGNATFTSNSKYGSYALSLVNTQFNASSSYVLSKPLFNSSPVSLNTADGLTISCWVNTSILTNNNMRVFDIINGTKRIGLDISGNTSINTICTHRISTYSSNQNIFYYKNLSFTSPITSQETAYAVISMTIDNNNNIYLCEKDFNDINRHNHYIKKISSTGVLSIVAGNGISGTPVPGIATSSPILPNHLDIDSFGNLYVTNSDTYISSTKVVVKINTSGVLSIIAGNGTTGTPVLGAATSSPLNGPYGIAVTPDGNTIYFTDSNSIIKMVNGVITSIITMVNYRSVQNRGKISLDSNGNLYYIDNNQVKKMSPTGTITIIAGNSVSGTPVLGNALSSPFKMMCAIVDNMNNVYIGDLEFRIYKVDSNGILSIIASNGIDGVVNTSVVATSSNSYRPFNMCFYPNGDILIQNISNASTATLVILQSVISYTNLPFTSPITAAETSANSRGIKVDTNNNIYFSQVGTGKYYIKKISASGVLSIVAGTGTSGAPVAGIATSSKLLDPRYLDIDSFGNLYVADFLQIVKINTSGVLSIIAGNGTNGTPVLGTATSSPLISPTGIAVTPDGNTIYSSDPYGNYIIKIVNGVITSIITMVNYSAVQNGSRISLDSNGNLYYIDNNQVKKMSPTGTITIIAGNSVSGTPVPGNALSSPFKMMCAIVDNMNNVYISDLEFRIYKVDSNGILSIVASNGINGVINTSVIATASPSYRPYDMCFYPNGNILIRNAENASNATLVILNIPSTTITNIDITNIVSISNNFTPNIYHNIALTIRGFTHTLYLDGTQVTEYSFASNILDNFSTISNIYLGSVSNISYGFTGYIDDFKVYNRALTSSEIYNNIYNA